MSPASTGPRTGTIKIAGLSFTVNQSEGCGYAIAPSAYSAGSAGGSTSVTVSAAAGCPWTATSNTSWISVGTASGSGNGAVSITVAPTNGVTRTGTAAIAGQTFTVTQSPGCAFEVTPLTHTFDPSGGTRTVNVTTDNSCAWTAASHDSWITLTGSSGGSGRGSVSFAVAPTTGPSRRGTLTVAGQTITVDQTPGCAYNVAPQTLPISSSGGSGAVTVTSGAGCAWTATSQAPWITIASGASGTGNGSVSINVAATSGPARSGTLTVAGRTVTINQGQGCTYAAAPQTLSVPSPGGNGTVSVTAGAGCGWTATSQASWITIASGASGSGNGTVTVNVAGTSGPARSGTLTVAGQTITVNQGQGCTFSLSPSSTSAPAAGGQGQFDVRTAGGCGWTAASDANWLTVSAGSPGSGNGTVQFSAAANPGPSRTGTLTAGGQTFTVAQDAGCSFSIAPSSQNAGSAGETVPVAVTTAGGCAWTATSNANWISIAAGNAGNGNGSVQLVVAANNDAARTGTATIAGQTFTVVQSAGCTYSLSPASQQVAAGGGPGSFTVNTGATCAWSAATSAGWISITSPGGTGPGPVQFSATANTGGARTGTITVAGQTFTVNQEGGCTAAVSPDTIASAAAGGSHNVAVTTAADCSWTSASNAPWISIAGAPGGTGNGTVQLAVAANTGPARTGTATVAARTVTVNQESGCTISISPSDQNVPRGGGTRTVDVTAGDGCTWNVLSGVPWITVTSGPSGTGRGTVQFTVDANGTRAERTGTISIGGRVFTVHQND